MSEKKIGYDDAYSLKTPKDSIKLYKKWAQTYDQNFALNSNYLSPKKISIFFNKHAKNTDTPILDVGAGTGLVGECLYKTGNKKIIGIDISPEMLEKAVLPETHQRKAIENVIRRGGGADVMPVDTFTKAAKDVAGTSQEGLGTRIVEKVKSLNPLSEGFDFAKAGDTIKDLGGKALNAVFRDKDGNLDKAAIMAALVTVPTFFEARALADEAGLGENEFTEEMYNASKADSKKTYESNLGSFFEGTGYTGNLAKGGRVNYAGGSDYKDFLQDKKDGIIPLDKTFNEWLDDNAPDPDYDKIYAKGGLIRRNYAFGDPDEYPETGDDITIFELIKEQGIPVGEQVRDKKIDVGAKSIQLAKVTDKQRQQMQHDMPYLTSGATDLQTVYENTKAWDDEGSKGFWGMGKREAEPMTKEEFKTRKENATEVGDTLSLLLNNINF